MHGLARALAGIDALRPATSAAADPAPPFGPVDSFVEAFAAWLQTPAGAAAQAAARRGRSG